MALMTALLLKTLQVVLCMGKKDLLFIIKSVDSICRDSAHTIPPYISLMWKDRLGGVVYLTVLCYHPYLVSMLFADLLSIHLVTFFKMFFSLVN